MLSDIDPFPSLLDDGIYDDGMMMNVPNFSANDYDPDDLIDLGEIFAKYFSRLEMARKELAELPPY